ncbi:MAG: hypothetical protein Q8S41_03885 [Lutibacter sp.]|nr:hypothetical protein [Lutibacter sp.]
MKIFARLLTAVFAVTLIVALSGFTSGDNNAAGHTRDLGCGQFDGYGGYVMSDSDMSVANHGGNVTLICKAKGVATPGYEVEQWGFACGIYDGYGNWHFTTNSYSVVSEFGDATLRCQVKKPKI